MAGSYELVYRVSRGRKEPDDTNVRINVSPPSCRDNWPLSWFIDFFFPSLLENYIYKYFKRREKRGEGEEEGGTFRELEKSLSRKYLFRYDRMCVTFMRKCCVATNFSLEALINGINLSRILRLNETIENTFHVCKIYNPCSTFVENARNSGTIGREKLSRIKYPSTVSLDSRDPGEMFTRQVFPALFPETFRCLSNAASGQRITRYNSTRRVLIRPQRADTPVAMQEGGGGGRWWLSVARSL